MAKHQPHSNCVFCGQKGHQLANCQKRLSILNSTGKANPNVQVLHGHRNSATPLFKQDYHPFGIQPNQGTQHFRSTPLLGAGMRVHGSSFMGFNPLYDTRRTHQYEALLQDFESGNHTFRKISNTLKGIRVMCQYPAMDLMRCGAINIEDHVCGGQPQPIYHRILQSPCVNPATGVKCLAGAKMYSFGTAKTYHTCAQFAPTDPNHPWNFGKLVCATCNIPHQLDIRCEIALDFAAPTYEQWKMQNVRRIQTLPFYASPRQRGHAKNSIRLRPKDNTRETQGLFQQMFNHFGRPFISSSPTTPPQRPLPPTPKQQKVHESLPRFQAKPETEETLYNQIKGEETSESKTLECEIPNRKQEGKMSSAPEQGKDPMESNKVFDFRSEEFQKYLWTPQANFVHQPLKDLKPFLSVHVPLLYWFAPSEEKWFKYQPTETAGERNSWRGTAFWYMPCEWISQFQKEKVPNAIFGMCPKSVCSGTTCEVYRFNGNLYCDHGYTDNGDAHKFFTYQFVSNLSKDHEKAQERIVNFFPITASKPCYRIRDSAQLHCPKVTQHTTDAPVYIFDGNFYCAHGYTNAETKRPEKFPLSLRPKLSEYWLQHNQEALGTQRDQETETEESDCDSLDECQNKLDQMKLSPKEPGTSLDTPNTVRINGKIPANGTAMVDLTKTKCKFPKSYSKEKSELESTPEKVEYCIHGYLPVDGHICKSVRKLSACVGRCLRNKCDYLKDFHFRNCPRVQPKRAGSASGAELGRKGRKQLMVIYEPDSGIFQGFNLPKRVSSQRYFSHKVPQRMKSNRTYPRRLNRFGKDPFISSTVHTDPELCPKSILKRHNSTYPYNITADSLNELH